MADHFESLYPENNSPSYLLVKFLAHRPRGSEAWDAEDITIFACDMHTWLSTAQFDSATHPRLCAVGALAGMYTFVTAVEPLLSADGRVCGATMKGHLYPKSPPDGDK